MKLDLTKEQYWNLMRGLYMADWMANAICEEDMEQDEGIKEVRDYIFSFAKEMGYENFAEFDEELGKYYATFDMDDEPTTRGLIERYDQQSTWDQLIRWLGQRDFFRKYTTGEIEKMTDEDRFMKRMECEDVWAEEFAKHDIDRLEIVEDKEEDVK